MIRKYVFAAVFLTGLLVLGYTASLPLGAASNCHKHHDCPTTSTTQSTTSTTPTTTTATSTTTTTTTTPVAPTPVPVGALLFGDEFNGTAGAEPSSTRWGAKQYHDNNGVCYFNGLNLIREDGSGNLAITAQKDPLGNWDCAYIAGALSYSGPRYVEARAKVPCGVGTWAAPLWETGHGAPQFEDDVIEQLGREPDAYHSTLHYWYVPGQSNQSGHTITASSTLCNDFHTYGAAVYSDHVDFYLDGAKVASATASAIGLTDLTTWQDEVNIDLDMGGTWAGTPTISGPVSMLVDYVHVYQLAIAPPPTTTAATTTTAQARLLFDDEFSGPSGSAPDPAKWKVYGGTQPNRWGSECFVNDRQHIYQDGTGNLVEKATYNPSGVPCTNGSGLYESGGMDTGNFPSQLFSFQYGRVEARIKVPCQSGYGMWPAWWMTGAGWPNGGEVDILEIMATTGHGGYDAAQHLHGAITAGGVWSLGHHDVSTTLWCGAFHVYGATWTTGKLAFTVDGAVQATFTPANMQTGWLWPFDSHPEKLFLDLQTGGAGGKIDNAMLPQTMLVDWVRVYAAA